MQSSGSRSSSTTESLNENSNSNDDCDKKYDNSDKSKSELVSENVNSLSSQSKSEPKNNKQEPTQTENAKTVSIGTYENGKMDHGSQPNSTTGNINNNKAQIYLEEIKIGQGEANPFNEEAKIEGIPAEIEEIFVRMGDWQTDVEIIQKFTDISVTQQSLSDNTFSNITNALQIVDFYKRFKRIRRQAPRETVEQESKDNREIIDFDKKLEKMIHVYADASKEVNSSSRITRSLTDEFHRELAFLMYK